MSVSVKASSNLIISVVPNGHARCNTDHWTGCNIMTIFSKSSESLPRRFGSLGLRAFVCSPLCCCCNHPAMHRASMWYLHMSPFFWENVVTLELTTIRILILRCLPTPHLKTFTTGCICYAIVSFKNVCKTALTCFVQLYLCS